jgi:hypothetical protein
MGSITNSFGLNSAANVMPMIAGVEITTDEAGRFNLNACIGLVGLEITSAQTSGCVPNKLRS